MEQTYMQCSSLLNLFFSLFPRLKACKKVILILYHVKLNRSIFNLFFVLILIKLRDIFTEYEMQTFLQINLRDRVNKKIYVILVKCSYKKNYKNARESK